MTATEPTLMRYVRTFARVLLVASIVAVAFTKIGPYRFGPFEFASPAWTFWILVPAITGSALVAYVKLLPDNAAVWRAQASEAEVQISETAELARANAEAEAAELIETARAEATDLAESTQAEAEAEATELIESAREDAATLTEENAEFARAKAEAEATRLIEAAREDASKLVESAREDAAKLVEAARAQAEVEASELIERARKGAAAEAENQALFTRALWMERGYGFPTVVAILEEIDERRDEEVSQWLASKANPAPKAAEVVRDHARRRRVAERERRRAQSVVEYYESIAPFLMDLKRETFGEDLEGVEPDTDSTVPSDLPDPLVHVAIVENM